MNPEDVITIMERVAAMLEPAAQQAWALAYRQVIIEGWVWLIAGTLSLLVFIASVIYAEASIEWGGWSTSGIMAFSVTGLGALVLVPCGVNGLMCLLNPHWYTIKMLMSLVK